MGHAQYRHRPADLLSGDADHVPPVWPDPTGPQQAHLDLAVEDLDEAEERVLALGAVKPDFQPGETWRVYADPAGHPFCLYEED